MEKFDDLCQLEQQNHVIRNNITKIKGMMRGLIVTKEWKKEVRCYFLEMENCLRIKNKLENKMPKFSDISKSRLDTCHPDIQVIFNKVIQGYDCSILCGHRGEQEQNEAYENGTSQLKWPDGNHNKIPSLAVDAIPYPIVWPDLIGDLRKLINKEVTIAQVGKTVRQLDRFYHFAGFVLAIGLSMGISLRWGGDWDMDKDFNDQNFNDLPHFELSGNLG